MATGYSDYRRSQMDASDTIHDHPCSPCSDEGKNTEAVFQCVDCQIFFCRRCVSGHNKFTKNHQVIDNNSKLFGQGIKQARKSSMELPSDVCEEHHGEVIKMFYGMHDEVCCSVCIAVKHRSCDGVEYIPNIAKGILQRPDKKKMITSLGKGRKERLQVQVILKNMDFGADLAAKAGRKERLQVQVILKNIDIRADLAVGAKSVKDMNIGADMSAKAMTIPPIPTGTRKAQSFGPKKKLWNSCDSCVQRRLMKYMNIIF